VHTPRFSFVAGLGFFAAVAGAMALAADQAELSEEQGMRLLIVHLAPKQTEARFALPLENDTNVVIAVQGVQNSEELTLVHQPWAVAPRSIAKFEFSCSLPADTLLERFDVRIGTNSGAHLYRIEITREAQQTLTLIDEIAQGKRIDSVSAR